MQTQRRFALTFWLAMAITVAAILFLSIRVGELKHELSMIPLAQRPRPASVLDRLLNPRVFAQTFKPSAYTPFAPIDFDRQLVPNVSTCPQAVTFYYSEIVITNLTAAAHTITVQDQQATPHFLFDATPVPANGVIQDTCLDGCKLTSGFCWQADAASALDGYVKGWNQ